MIVNEGNIGFEVFMTFLKPIWLYRGDNTKLLSSPVNLYECYVKVVIPEFNIKVNFVFFIFPEVNMSETSEASSFVLDFKKQLLDSYPNSLEMVFGSQTKALIIERYDGQVDLHALLNSMPIANQLYVLSQTYRSIVPVLFDPNYEEKYLSSASITKQEVLKLKAKGTDVAAYILD